MFNLQGSEIVIILLLALVVLGPEKLPDAMRKAGKAYSELKKMSSGFQSEFRAVVDEPMREIRETANVLRDSADFTKFQDGERDEKPKSGEMAPVDPDAVPTDNTPTFETPADGGPAAAPDSAPAPFDGDEPAGDDAAPMGRTPVTAPAPFTGMSSAALRPDEAQSPTEPPKPAPFSGVSSAAPRHQEAPRVDADASAPDAHDTSDNGQLGPDVSAPANGADAEQPATEVLDDERESAVADGDR